MVLAVCENIFRRDLSASQGLLTSAGGSIVSGPFDIKIGKCVVVADPWGNRLVLLDSTKGLLKTNNTGNVIS